MIRFKSHWKVPRLRLLSPEDPPVAGLENPRGGSSVVLVCEHGGRAYPSKLRQLGLTDQQARRHFAWDIGALDLARALAAALDAPLLHQRYSRLICDGNRKPSAPSFIPAQGEEISIPGNAGISNDERNARLNEVWKPFHDNLSDLLDQRDRSALKTILISIHSFTPVFLGERRSLKVGILCDRERRFSDPLYMQLQQTFGEHAALNEPYDMTREDDYTIPVHAEDRGLLCAEIEVRNDLISNPVDIALWAEILHEAISGAIDAVAVNIRAEAKKQND